MGPRFNGGCWGCDQLLRICPGCYYFEGDIEKPVLNPSEIKQKEEIKKLRELAIKAADEWKKKGGEE